METSSSSATSKETGETSKETSKETGKETSRGTRKRQPGKDTRRQVGTSDETNADTTGNNWRQVGRQFGTIRGKPDTASDFKIGTKENELFV